MAWHFNTLSIGLINYAKFYYPDTRYFNPLSHNVYSLSIIVTIPSPPFKGLENNHYKDCKSNHVDIYKSRFVLYISY